MKEISQSKQESFTARSISYWQEKINSVRLKIRSSKSDALYSRVLQIDGSLNLSRLSNLSFSNKKYVLERQTQFNEATKRKNQEVLGCKIIYECPDIKFEDPEGNYQSATESLLTVIFSIIKLQESSRYQTNAVALSDNPDPVRATLGYKGNLQEKHPQQYSIDPLRTILSNPDPQRRVLVTARHTNELIKSLYQVATIFEHTVEPLEKYLDTITANSRLQTPTIIELMSNLGILYDKRFRALALFLREYSFRHFSSAEELEANYRFSTFRLDAPFWKEGELQNIINKVYSSRITGKQINPDYSEKESYTLPEISSWDSAVHANRQRERQIAALSPLRIVSQVLLQNPAIKNTDEVRDRRVNGAQSALIKRQTLITEYSINQRNLLASQVAGHTLFFQDVMRNERFVQQDRSLFTTHIQALCESFQFDRNLHSKSKQVLNFFALYGEESTAEYTINIEELMENPLFSWLGRHSQKNKFTVQEQPNEHIHIAKLLVYELLKKTASIHEDKFLFTESRDFSQQDLDNTLNFFDLVRESSRATSPEHTYLSKGYNSISDLLTIESERKRKLVAKKWRTYPLIGALRFPYHVDISYKLLRNATISIVTGLGLLAAIYGYSSLYGQSVESSALGRSESIAQAPLEGSNDWLNSRDIMSVPPDRLSPEQLEKRKPRKFLSTVMLPASMELQDGESIGFFPLDHSVFLDGSHTDVPVIQVNEDTDIVVKPGQLAFEFASPNNWGYPPEGYKFVSVYQQGGETPFISSVDNILYRESNTTPPEKIVYIAEPSSVIIPQDRNGKSIPGVTIYKDKDLPGDEYKVYGEGVEDVFSYTKEYMQRTYDLLNASPFKDLYADFMDDYGEAVASGDSERISQIVTEYASRYYQLVQKTRFYSLNFFKTNTVLSENYFIKIANNLDSGYYCSIAAYGFNGFLQGTGIKTEFLQGSLVYYYEGEGWLDLGHVKNLIHLPNGSQLIVDTTPPITAKTPQEDIKAIEPKSPDDLPINYKEIIDDFIEKSLPITINTGILLALAAGVSALYKHLSIRKQVENFNKLLQLSKLELGADPRELSIVTRIIEALSIIPVDHDRELCVEQIIAVLHLLQRTDISDGTSFIDWASEHTGLLVQMKQFGASYFHQEGNTIVYKNIIDALKKEYSERPTSITEIIPEKDRNFFEANLLQNNFTVEQLPPHIIDYIEMAILVAKMKMVDTVTYLNNFSYEVKHVIRGQEELRLQKTVQKERLQMVDLCIKQLVNSGESSEKNARYLAYILKTVNL